MHEHHAHTPGTSGFYGLGIAPSILEILERLHFVTPTPIQAQAIPVAIEGKDVVGIAQTGTGKTMAFGIPMMQRLAIEKKQGLVVAPTRELALQIDDVFRKIGTGVNLRTAVLIGGASMQAQVQALGRKPHIIVATPGRLIDHLNQRTLRLNGVGIVVLDEADHMLDMGFLPQIQKILAAVPKERQTMLFSATMPSEIMKLAGAHMKLPIRVEIAPAGTTVEGVQQELFIVSADRKLALLKKILETYHGSTLVFTRTKHGAKKVTRDIRAFGFSAAEIHSNRSLSQRKEALQGFKSGKYRVLVATDIAARGIDVVGIELVLNYDLPSTSDDYVHRIGRTARAGAAGHAITFAQPGQQNEVRSIERLIRKSLSVSKLPELSALPTPPPIIVTRTSRQREGRQQRRERPEPYYDYGRRRRPMGRY
ncbi:DEAD/DEAH box helicase [Candidatus Uhrbacteria bacterium]|nr:DEAD/DEAH box helicase [Candidatus Uhrbacteria bacterium]